MDQTTQQRRTPLPSSNPGSVHEPSPTRFTDEHTKVEDLPLDKKLEVLRKYNPYDYYEENRYIDAQDTVNSWCLGQIVQVDNKSLNIHFDGWSSRWDVWQKVTSYKIAPFRKNSRGYTGQNKVALRQNMQFNLEDLQLHKQRVQRFIDNDLNGFGAFETTQYLRGGLYIYVDFLLQHSSFNEEYIDAINDFLYNVLRLIVTWLKKIPKLVPLYAQLKVNSDLFLIDENIAILQSAYELLDTLKKLFCCCHRCIKFYLHNDKNPVNFEHPVTVKMDHINFEQNRKIDDDNLDIDEIRDAVSNRKNLNFGQFMNFINYFAEIGGFDAIIDFLKYESDNADDKIPLEMYSLMTLPFKNCIDIFSPTFALHFVNSVKDITVNRLKTISEKELKEIDKESVGRMLNDLREFLTLALTEEQTAEIIESNILIMALRFLKSTYLEKRLKGISDIKNIIDRIEIQLKRAKLLQQQNQDDFRQDARGQQKKYLNQQNYQDLMDPNMRMNKPPKYLTPDILKNWILNEKILEIVLGENTHLEIVKRSGCILKFLAKQDALPLDSIDLIWKSQLGKHEEMVRVIYQMIQELVPNLESKYIDIFYQKIQQVPASQYDDKFLEFLKDFTQKSLESHYELKNNEGSMAETSPIPYEEYIIQKERNILQKIGEAIQNQNNLFAEEKQYGLPIFWDLIQDKAPIQVTNEIMVIGINSLCEILKQNYSHPIRMHYLLKALDNLAKGESIVQSITIAQNIINEYSLFEEPRQSVSQQLVSQSSIIVQLNKQVQLIDCIIKNILNYHEQVKEKIKTLATQKKTLPEDVSNYVFIGKNSHDSIINQLLQFLEFLIVQSNLQVNIGTHNIDNLWQIFVQQPNFISDQNIFLKWINSHRESQYEKREYFLFNDEERKYFFTKILCNPTYVQKIPYGQVKCFHKYFKVINRQEENVELIRRRLCVINYDKLIGLDTLWRIAIESENDKSREESMDLLVDLHLKFDQSITQQDQQRIWGNFVDQCMKNLDSPDDGLVANTLQLISRFLDRYEGKKTLKPEFKSSQFTNLQPLQITVLLRNDQTRKVVHVSYFQTIGYLRQKIAEAFEFQINEFLMYIKNSYVDPDEDDDKYIKEIGLVQSVIIQKNNMYNPENHPKFLISNNHSNYDKLFYLLSKENPSLIETTWDLLSKLPVNAKLQQEIKELSGVMDNAKNWEKILDPKSTNKLLYSLKIINNLHAAKKDQKSQRWRYKFVQMGGFTHLLKTFISLEIKQIDTNLTIKCIEQLIMILDDFITNDKELIKEVLENKNQVVMKSINFVDLISDYSIAIEKKRGYSFEDLTKRIQQNKQKKNKYKSYMAVNKGNQGAQQQQQQEEEDDQESQEYNQAQLFMKQFHEDSQIIYHLFKFIFLSVFTHDPSSATAVTKYQNLEGLIIKSTVMCENWLIRIEVLKQLKELLNIRNKNHPQEMIQMQEILNVMLFRVTQVTEKYEQRCSQFYESLSLMIENQHISEFEVLQNQCQKLIEELAQQIYNREIREKNTQDSDQLLVGKMRLLKSLLFKFPQFKLATGNILTDHLLHTCLFEVPQGGTTKNQNKQGPPKCKSYLSRRSAVLLLSVLCRDCVPNLVKVLNYMQQFNQNPSWRTNKDHDWNISLMDSEKSSTGYVGIKNLGCICYMNSLFQQLFMIQSFRNDLLSAKDPSAEKVEKEENMLYQLQVLFAGLLKSEKQYVSPKGFCHAFKDWEGQPTNVLEQMDVEEFFNMLMDRIETAIKTTPQQDTIKYHFGGKFASEMICKGCPHKYEREEPFLSISIPVKNKKSILEGLNAFIQGDMLEGDNAYLCEKCDKKVDALKRTCVKRLPRYLIVALRRFEFDYDKMIRVKVNDYCEFPMEFSMEPYTQEGLARREKLQKMREERGEDDNGAGDIEMDPLKYPNDYYEYSLSGIVVHSGTADSGHYYSFVKDREHPESGKWYELNDHIVRDFDPNDIPQECYGGEDTFQSYNMVQMKSMKWRNAYLLFYERKTPVDVVSEDENERSNVAQPNQSKEDVEMKNAHNSQEVSILQEIEEQIAYENQKYWQNRFLFGNEYHEFVYDLSLYWNTNSIIPMNYLTKNNDSHLVGYQMPKEYEKDGAIREPQDLKMPINIQLVPELEERVFKFATQFYITILQRSQMKIYIPQMLNLLKGYINKNYNCASWLLSEFCNLKIIEENLLQCGSKEMRKFIVGLLYSAMLKVYPEEQAQLNLYWTNPDPNKNKTVLGNLALVLIYNVFYVKKFIANSSQYFQLIARLSSLGSAMREFLLKGKLVGRLMEFFFDDVSPHRDFFRDFSDINPHFKELPDIGLPTEINRKQMSQFQELLERRRMKNLQDAPPKYKYLIEAVSNCIRGFKNGANRSPYQLDDIQFESLLSQERDLFIPESKFLKKVFAESKKNRSIAYACKCYIHFTWTEQEGFKELLGVIQNGLNENDYDDIKPYLMLVQFLLQNPGGENPESRMDIVLQVFLETVKRNLQFYKFMEVIIDFVFKIVSRIPKVKEWFYKKKNQWIFLNEWSQESKFPINPNDNQQNLKVYKKRNNMQLQQQFLRGEYVRNMVYRDARLKRMELLLNGNVTDLSAEIDIDLIDLQDYKFVVGEIVELYYKRQEKLQSAQVEQVLDEMIQVKLLNQQQVDNYQQQNNNTQWIGCDTDKLMLHGTFKNQYKNKLLEYCASQQQQMRMRQEMQGNPQMRQSMGQGSIQGGNPNDMEYDMNDNPNYGGQGNFGESDDDDNQSDNGDIYD